MAEVVNTLADDEGDNDKVQLPLSTLAALNEFLAEKNAIGLINYPFPQNQKLNRDKGSYLKVN